MHSVNTPRKNIRNDDRAMKIKQLAKFSRKHILYVNRIATTQKQFVMHNNAFQYTCSAYNPCRIGSVKSCSRYHYIV